MFYKAQLGRVGGSRWGWVLQIKFPYHTNQRLSQVPWLLRRGNLHHYRRAPRQQACRSRTLLRAAHLSLPSTQSHPRRAVIEAGDLPFLLLRADPGEGTNGIFVTSLPSSCELCSAVNYVTTHSVVTDSSPPHVFITFLQKLFRKRNG